VYWLLPGYCFVIFPILITRVLVYVYDVDVQWLQGLAAITMPLSGFVNLTGWSINYCMKQYEVNDDSSIKFVRNNQQVVNLFGNNLYYVLDQAVESTDAETDFHGEHHQIAADINEDLSSDDATRASEEYLEEQYWSSVSGRTPDEPSDGRKKLTRTNSNVIN